MKETARREDEAEAKQEPEEPEEAEVALEPGDALQTASQEPETEK